MSQTRRSIYGGEDGYAFRLAYENRSFQRANTLLEKIGFAQALPTRNTLVVHRGSGIRTGAEFTSLSFPTGYEESYLEQVSDEFDFVVSLDMLGEIQIEDHESYLSRLDKIARYGVVVIDVFDSLAVRGAQKMVLELSDRLATDQNRIPELQVSGLMPDVESVREMLTQQGERATKHVCLQSLSEWLIETCLAFYSIAETQGGVVDLLRTIGTFDRDSYVSNSHDPAEHEPYVQALITLKGVEQSQLDLDAIEIDRITQGSSFGTAESYRLALSERDGRIVRQSEQIRDLSARIARLGSNLQTISEHSDNRNPNVEEYEEYRRQNLELQRQNLELQDRNSALQKQFDTVRQQNSIVRERNKEMLSNTAESKDRISELEKQNLNLRERLNQVMQSRSWQMTSFLRRQG